MTTIVKVLIILILLCPSIAVAEQIGIVESWHLVSGIQNLHGGQITQVYEIENTVQSPLQTHQQLNFNQSYAGAYINATIDDQNLTLVVQPQQHCERTNTSLPSCLSLGELMLQPSVDVVFSFSGAYTYYLSSPSAVFGEMKVTQMTPSGATGPIVASQAYFYDSFSGPNGVLEFDRSITLFAGNRYWIKYRLLSHASYDMLPPGSFVDGNGMLTIETHPVPEPSTGMLGMIIFAISQKRLDRASLRW